MELINSHMAGQLDTFKDLKLLPTAISFQLCDDDGNPSFHYPIAEDNKLSEFDYLKGCITAIVTAISFIENN